ncbi:MULTISPECIES: HPr family phosphocarrier protein [unclassified Spiroplasma]|uniref:HPr family phosphocarrier protein n=1 Tax=unclassified Spiroplasma TaxID=2637901 RepID=UPI0027DF2A83|nr:hypothetical protein [Spiroplasma sp. AdecLV25b]
MNSIIYAVQIIDEAKIGLHARPVSKITGKLAAFKETTVKAIKLNDNADVTKNITIENGKLTGTDINGKLVSGKDLSNEVEGNAKSVLSLLGLGVKHLNKMAFIIINGDSEAVKKAIHNVLLEEKLIK